MITLRDVVPEDVAFFEQALADDRIWTLTERPESARWMITVCLNVPKAWIACLDGVSVGACSVVVGAGAKAKCGEWGGWLLPDATKKGVATEALKIALGWAEQQGLVRVESRPAADNLPSHAVLERAGMRLESIAANAFCRRDEILDEFVYVWTKE